ncbi:MAG: hypothetical protein FWC27_00960 [Firmicutes bacterium]|nr:hypothetical protein [Bacillota bacterium]
MKKAFFITLMLLVGLCACGRTTPTEETTTAEEKTTRLAAGMDTVFSSVIEDMLSRPSGYDTLSDFVLYGTDDEGAKALLVGVENPFSYVSEIFTFQNGAAEQVLSVDYDTGDTYICPLKTGVIQTGSFSGSVNSYYRFNENGQFKLILKLGSYGDDRGLFRVDPTGGESDFFFCFIPDGTEVHITQEEFERLHDQYEGDGQVVELDWKPLAEYGQ